MHAPPSIQHDILAIDETAFREQDCHRVGVASQHRRSLGEIALAPRRLLGDSQRKAAVLRFAIGL
jgi:hypothetical protein